MNASRRFQVSAVTAASASAARPSPAQGGRRRARSPPAARRQRAVADVLPVGPVVDRHHRDAAVAQQQAQAQPDLAQPDDHDVVGARTPRRPRSPVRLCLDQALDEAAGERGGEQQGDRACALEIASLNHSGSSWTAGFGSTVTSVLTAP